MKTPRRNFFDRIAVILENLSLRVLNIEKENGKLKQEIKDLTKEIIVLEEEIAAIRIKVY
jgi:cell division protein FtsB